MDIEELKKYLRDPDPVYRDDDAKAMAQAADALSQLQAEVERLNGVIAKQAKAAIMGMDAAKSGASAMLEAAKKAQAESSPEALASERAANAILTAENAELRRELEEARKDAGRWKTAKSLCGIFAGWWQVQIRPSEIPADTNLFEAAFERDIDAARQQQR